MSFIRYSIKKEENLNLINRIVYDDNAVPIEEEAYPIENEDYEMLNNISGRWDFSRLARLTWKLARLESAQKI